jgi:hypothetical protein
MSNANIIKTAEKAVLRTHKTYGETFLLLKYLPSSTGGIYRQRTKRYDSPIEMLGCVSRIPKEEMLTEIGEGGAREAHITVPVALARHVFGGNVEDKSLITTSDMVVVDNRVWRITQCELTARVGDTPLIFDIDLRERLDAREEDYV